MINFTDKYAKIFKTAALYFAYTAFGLCIAIPGPTLLDLQQIANTDSSTIAFIYLSRSSACLIGSIIGGIVFDLVRQQQLLLAFASLLLTVGIFAAPFCSNINALVGVWAQCGFSMGVIDIGCTVLCLSIWGEESAPYYQAMHFLFGVGGAIAPLIAEPFLLKSCDVDTSETATLSTTYTYTSTLKPTNSTKIKISCNTESFPSVAYAYIIIGTFASFVTLFFLLVSILFPEKNKTEKSKVSDDGKMRKNTITYTIIIMILCSVLICLNTAVEIGYPQMLAIFAVKGDLKLSKSTASFMTALFWGTFTATRGISIYLSYRFSAFTLVISDIVAVLLGCGILLGFAKTYVEALWAGTFVLAAGTASIFPSVITWVRGYITISSKMASLVTAAATFGVIMLPLTFSPYVESQPHVLTYLIMACSTGGCLVAVVLWFVMNRMASKK